MRPDLPGLFSSGPVTGSPAAGAEKGLGLPQNVENSYQLEETILSGMDQWT